MNYAYVPIWLHFQLVPAEKPVLARFVTHLGVKKPLFRNKPSTTFLVFFSGPK